VRHHLQHLQGPARGGGLMGADEALAPRGPEPPGRGSGRPGVGWWGSVGGCSGSAGQRCASSRLAPAPPRRRQLPGRRQRAPQPAWSGSGSGGCEAAARGRAGLASTGGTLAEGPAGCSAARAHAPPGGGSAARGAGPPPCPPLADARPSATAPATRLRSPSPGTPRTAQATARRPAARPSPPAPAPTWHWAQSVNSRMRLISWYTSPRSPASEATPSTLPHTTRQLPITCASVSCCSRWRTWRGGGRRRRGPPGQQVACSVPADAL
jgi:hypothetical protein